MCVNLTVSVMMPWSVGIDVVASTLIVDWIGLLQWWVDSMSCLV